MNNRRLLFLGTLLAIGTVVLTLVLRAPHHDTQKEGRYEQAAVAFERSNIMSREDFLRLTSLETDPKSPCTDADIHWLSVKLASSQDPVGRAMFADAFSQVRDLSPAQENIAYQAIIPMFNSRQRLDKKYACIVLSELKDRRAISQMERLLSDPDTTVAADARFALAKLK